MPLYTKWPIPEPTKWMPLGESSLQRRVESVNSLLPPSMMMSPASRWGSWWSVSRTYT